MDWDDVQGIGAGVLLILVGSFLGFLGGRDWVYRRAIEHNVAEYRVDKEGNVSFHWLGKPETE